MDPHEIRDILKFGILAPSADNSQPWKFKISPDQIDLFLDPKQTDSFCDQKFFVPYLSAGAVIENIRVAAAKRGTSVSVSYLPNSVRLDFVATIKFGQHKENTQSHFPALEKRTTNRKFYSSKNIEPTTYSKLERTFENESNFRLLWIKKNDSKFGQLGKILGQSDRLRFEVKRVHEEFIQILRLTRMDSERTRDGLDFKTLESGPGSILLFKLISSWNRLNLLNKIGLSSMFNFYTQLQIQSSQACGLIISKKHAPLQYVQGGEIMQRFWHEATVQNLSLQPMEALPIFLIQLKESGCKDFNVQQINELKHLKSKFYSLFSIEEDNGLIFLFRIGYAKNPSSRSLRRPPESFLVK